MGSRFLLVAMTVLATGYEFCFAHASGFGEGLELVVADRQAEGEAFLVSDFGGLLGKALGRSVPVVRASSPGGCPKIFFGIRPRTGERQSLKPHEWIVRSDGTNVWLYGGGANGMRYAAYDFLESDLGFRFYDMRGGMRVPDLRDFRLKPFVRRRMASFEHRCFIWKHFNRPESTLFLYRNGQSCYLQSHFKGDGVDVTSDDYSESRSGHSIPDLLPRKDSDSFYPCIRSMGRNLEREHPECFSMNEKGKRVFDHQRCFSNPLTRKLAEERLLALVAAQPEFLYYDFSAGDTPGRFCHCPGCLALEKKYGSRVGPLLDCLLALSPALGKANPNARIKFLVYRKDQTQRPPAGIAHLPENLVPQFAPIDDDFSKDWRHPRNAETYEDLKRWCSISSHSLLWYYPNPYGLALTPPIGNVGRLVRDMKMAWRAGVTGPTYEQDVDAVAEMSGFTELQNFLMLQLAKDIDCDPKALALEFMRYEYGAATSKLMAYWMELEKLSESESLRLEWNPSISAYTHLTPERLVRWNAAFDEMERMLADDPGRLFNLRRIRLCLDYAIVMKYSSVRAACPDFPLSADVVADRLRATRDRIAKELYAPNSQSWAESMVKRLEDEVFSATICNVPNAKPLPDDIFGRYRKEKLFVTVPKVRGADYEKDPDAAYGVAAVKTRPAELFAQPLSCFLYDNAAKKPTWGLWDRDTPLGPRGEYRFYRLARTTLVPDCMIDFGHGSWWDIICDLGNAWVPGSHNRVDIWISLKFEGPAFYPEDANKPNRILSDRVVVVPEDAEESEPDGRAALQPNAVYDFKDPVTGVSRTMLGAVATRLGLDESRSSEDKRRPIRFVKRHDVWEGMAPKGEQIIVPGTETDSLKPFPVLRPVPGYLSDAHRAFQGVPSVTASKNGRLWVAINTGGTSEGEDNAVIVVTSGDGGRTWSKPLFAIDHPGPLRVLDAGFWTDPEGDVWLFYSQVFGFWDGRAGLWVMKAVNPDDPETTWSAPRRICDGYLKNKPTVLADGRILLPVEFFDPQFLGLSGGHGNARTMAPTHVHDCSRYDHGNVFVASGGFGSVSFLGQTRHPVKEHTFPENMVIERGDGTLWMLSRMSYGIGEADSSDGGRTWTDTVPSKIKSPSSRFYVGRLQSGALLLVKSGDMNEDENRNRIFAYVSDDDGYTWLGGLELDARDNTSYPDAVQTSDGFIHVVNDFDREGAKEIVHHRFMESDVRSGRIVADGGHLAVIVNRAGR